MNWSLYSSTTYALEHSIATRASSHSASYAELDEMSKHAASTSAGVTASSAADGDGGCDEADVDGDWSSRGGAAGLSSLLELGGRRSSLSLGGTAASELSMVGLDGSTLMSSLKRRSAGANRRMGYMAMRSSTLEKLVSWSTAAELGTVLVYVSRSRMCISSERADIRGRLGTRPNPSFKSSIVHVGGGDEDGDDNSDDSGDSWWLADWGKSRAVDPGLCWTTCGDNRRTGECGRLEGGLHVRHTTLAWPVSAHWPQKNMPQTTHWASDCRVAHVWHLAGRSVDLRWGGSPRLLSLHPSSSSPSSSRTGANARGLWFETSVVPTERGTTGLSWCWLEALIWTRHIKHTGTLN
ncbi:hypothetical protein H257_03748 [Aphanomyces astaci]|uniref:Uncharacterized protein n=1 Tax=Aphanomyces astaci TaxID=112090 RepID=W4GXZ8_APHAT|nr:hypothetical protein H257_03748 [Aphanomyces astaci]ETV84580.1 hypothetical protein H257_03748 [Aphanomyces astaci]|eukprot:XP_009826272.1 hypothetical protein H257_03748 [Aphanomyces astaci]